MLHMWLKRRTWQGKNAQKLRDMQRFIKTGYIIIQIEYLIASSFLDFFVQILPQLPWC